MSDDLEKFLQRAAQRRRQRSQPGIVIINEPEVIEPEIIEAEVAPRKLSSLGSESVGQHVQRHLDSRQFQDRADQLGDRVETADDDMDRHIHEVFDHKLGTLQAVGDDPGSISDDAPKSAPPAHWLAAMLRDPDTMRKAIIINEIMTPAFRRQQ